MTRKSIRWWLGISMAMTIVICAVMNFLLIPAIERSTEGIRCFDMNFAYSTETARHFLSLLSEQGRRVYLTRQLPLDFLYPVAYSVCFSLLIRATAQRKTKLVFLPVLLAVLDYGENLCVLRMLTQPSVGDRLIIAASVFTSAKTVMMYVCFVLIVVLLIRYVIHRRKEKASIAN